jgi:23S rRNA (cytidine1920-2'-O)/16S rRNA (cytidine1409-2'-O)-methyltransferase
MTSRWGAVDVGHNASLLPPPENPVMRPASGTRAVSSAVERLVYTERVGGSIPSLPTIYRRGTMAAGIRADQALVDRELVESRSRAQALILAGLVFSGEKKIEKAGQPVRLDAPLEVRGRDHPWVSRGGVKLAHGLAHFGWNVDRVVAIDVGSSTGGFTDVLLTNGAARVYAVDSGTNQLAWKLRSDARVVVLEQTNARHLTDSEIPEPVDVIVCDASFISLAKVLARAIGFARPGARLLALVKPQFEAGREEVGKGGVIRDPLVHERVCAAAADWIRTQGWDVCGITPSPITGPEGNVEFLMAAVKR